MLLGATEGEHIFGQNTLHGPPNLGRRSACKGAAGTLLQPALLDHVACLRRRATRQSVRAEHFALETRGRGHHSESCSEYARYAWQGSIVGRKCLLPASEHCGMATPELHHPRHCCHQSQISRFIGASEPVSFVTSVTESVRKTQVSELSQ